MRRNIDYVERRVMEMEVEGRKKCKNEMEDQIADNLEAENFGTEKSE